MAGHTRDERVILSDGAIAAEPILRKVDSKRSIEGLLIAVTLERITGQLRNENHLRAQRGEAHRGPRARRAYLTVTTPCPMILPDQIKRELSFWLLHFPVHNFSKLFQESLTPQFLNTLPPIPHVDSMPARTPHPLTWACADLVRLVERKHAHDNIPH